MKKKLLMLLIAVIIIIWADYKFDPGEGRLFYNLPWIQYNSTGFITRE